MMDIQKCTECELDKPTLRRRKKFVCAECHAKTKEAAMLLLINNGNIQGRGF